MVINNGDFVVINNGAAEESGAKFKAPQYTLTSCLQVYGNHCHKQDVTRFKRITLVTDFSKQFNLRKNYIKNMIVIKII